MRRIPLRNRQGGIVAHALVDDADYKRLNRWRWYRDTHGYAVRSIGRTKLLMHRLILGLDFGDPREGDHQDLNPLNNRQSNLRILPPGGNNQNTNGWVRSRAGIGASANGRPR